jgi:D-alanine-D-alanine ligase
LLESLGLSFTGCSASALALTSDKPLAKRLLASAGIATPAAFAPGIETGRWIVKSVWEHASLGLDDGAIVAAASAAQALERRRAELGGDWFAEEFVPGRELNVSLLAGRTGPRVLPVAEIRFDAFPADKPRIVGYAAKWDVDSFEYRNTPRSFAVEPELAAVVGRLALDCWALFRLDGYARVDFRVDDRGVPWVLEVNANPCLSPDAGFAAALSEAGIEYGAAIATLLDDALARSKGHLL